MILRNILTAASALALAACAVGPNYAEPKSASAPVATGPFISANSPAVSLAPVAADWWRLYDDPVLDGLIGQALAEDNELEAAAANLRRVRAALGEARVGRWKSEKLLIGSLLVRG